MAALLTVLAIVLLWVAAVAFGPDSRDGRDWSSRAGVGDRVPRLRD